MFARGRHYDAARLYARLCHAFLVYLFLLHSIDTFFETLSIRQAAYDFFMSVNVVNVNTVLEYLYSNFQSIFFQMYGNISIKCLPGINEQAKIFLRIAFSSAGESETYEDPHFVTIMQLIASRMSVSH